MMKAKITDGKYKGIEFEVSDKTIQNIEKKVNLKVNVWAFEATKGKNDTYFLGVCGGYKDDYLPGCNVRGGFFTSDIKRIIKGLQQLIGE